MQTSDEIAREEILLSFQDDNKREQIRESLDDLYWDVTKTECELDDPALKDWFFKNYVYFDVEEVWKHKAEIFFH